MMLAGVTLVESRGCVNLWSMEYSSVCVVSSRHQIESPDEKRIEYMIQGHDHWSYPTITSLNYPARASSRLIFVGVSRLPRILGSMMPTLIRMMNSYDRLLGSWKPCTMMDAIITCWEDCTSSDLFLGGGILGRSTGLDSSWFPQTKIMYVGTLF